MLLAQEAEELQCWGHVPSPAPWSFLGGALLHLLPAACLTGMVSEGAEALEGATGAEVLKAVSKGSAPEEASPAATPPTSPVPSFAWGGRCGPAVAKDVNPEVLRSGVACLPGEYLGQHPAGSGQEEGEEMLNLCMQRCRLLPAPFLSP